MLYKKKIIFRGPKYIFYFFCLIFFNVIGALAKAFCEKYRDVWIVSERGVDARDNAYHFYKYVRENYPKIKCYYIIDKNSADYDRVAKYGNIVNYRSFKHNLLFSVSDYKISTHIMGYSPDVLCYTRLQRLGLFGGKIVFLQHGIINSDIEWMFYPRTRLDLFVSGAEKECEAIKSRFGYPEGVVKLLGLCRYDALEDESANKKQILLMPTWRGSFTDMTKAAEFKATDYFKNYNALINNKTLLEFLQQEDLKLIFYPHYEAQKFLNTFEADGDRVVLASFEEFDVQTLLKQSKLLITDFSSVFFDFAYMGKPCVFFQFDEDVYRAENYAKGYFDYISDGFGPVFDSVKDTVRYITDCAERQFCIEDIYKDRINGFFGIRDRNNCKRNFEAIMNL